MPEPSVGVLFYVAQRAVEQRVLAALQAGGHDVTAAQGRLFARIGPDGTRLTELAARAQVTKQTAGFLVDQLVRAGYVERVLDPTDARARLVRIAERGRVVQRLASRIEREVYAEWTGHLGEQEMARLHRTMLRLREITDPFAEGADEAG
ncbi:MarR family winged helix-turn-helix transcriptional regulator [Aeromicrobium wangtongii]|uniref:MarR family winged helix-turn-helix transcriptional regulator n=1 Tax=Aeromicrobium wangtongii TaxID=2969247 RepID=UPI002017DEDF|nr:MarR family winged helix-turn-helix transcriptional regulator [Aeromicrobium wangtongii]MCL3819927.1 MarR family winged helix-turn-helix transcriptional regulator [Aeromicrobium wangtongii]